MSKKIVYAFYGYEDLFFYDGQFWLKEKACKKVYNSGTTQIRQGRFSVGLKKLRKLAYKKEVEIVECPF
jgi:hypothetical protein